MGITSNASRIQVQTSAKNGTLAAQGAITANQILLDTNISTNNSNLVASPTLVGRSVLLREGAVDEEVNLIETVAVDGVTCTCKYDWVDAPASGDTYDIGYILDDVATVTGCTKDSTTLEFAFTRKLQVGQNSSTLALMFMGHYEVARLHDNGAATESLEVINGSRLDIGMERDEVFAEGASLIFSNDGDGETVMQVRNGAIFNAYDFSFIAARASDSITLAVSVIAGGVVNWGQGTLLGITGPFQTRRQKFKGATGSSVLYSTVGELKASPPQGGWCASEADQTIKDFILGENDNAKVYLTVEDA